MITFFLANVHLKYALNFNLRLRNLTKIILYSKYLSLNFDLYKFKMNANLIYDFYTNPLVLEDCPLYRLKIRQMNLKTIGFQHDYIFILLYHSGYFSIYV